MDTTQKVKKLRLCNIDLNQPAVIQNLLSIIGTNYYITHLNLANSNI